MAPKKNNTRPAAATIPTPGIATPTSNPTAPEVFKAPSVNSHERGMLNLSMLAKTHETRLKSLLAA
jgi:hypothetical protein